MTRRFRLSGHVSHRLAALALVAALSSCSSTPPPPDWQMNAKSSLERAVAAHLSGNQRLEALEYARARSEVARTGRPDLMARIELTRCAAQVASLVFEACPAYDALAPDATAADQAYGRYLSGQANAGDAALLPEPQRAAAAGSVGASQLNAIADPVSRLVAAGVALRTRRMQPEAFEVAAQTASAQGWRRPLLAWLNVQVQRAEAAGQGDEAARLRRRVALVLGPAQATVADTPASAASSVISR
jgi:hypothetical protein